MDSFYEAPRRAPLPRPVYRPFTPSVPDISLCHNSVTSTNSLKHSSNNDKKMLDSNYGNHLSSNLMRKHVRFESPKLLQKDKLLGCESSGDNKKHIEEDTNVMSNNNPVEELPSSAPHFFKGKPFQEIYMANIPNRHLDLSLIDIVKPIPNIIRSSTDNDNLGSVLVENKENSNNRDSRNIEDTIPTTYREYLDFCEKQQVQRKSSKYNIEEKREVPQNYMGNSDNSLMSADFVTDIYNYGAKHNTLPNAGCKIQHNKKNNSFHRAMGKQVHDNKKVEETDSKSDTNSSCTKSKYVFNKEQFTHSAKGVYDRNSCTTHDCHKLHTNTENNSDQKIHSTENRNGVNIPQNNNFQKIHNCCDNLRNCMEIPQTVEALALRKVANSDELDVKKDEPTVKDLLKIIQQQNEQLLFLQKQVASLLDFKEPKRIEPPRVNDMFGDKYAVSQSEQVGSTSMKTAGSTPRKGPLPKFSIDLMTSFEVSFRPQQNMFQRKQTDFIHHKPRIEEITESESTQFDCITNDKGMAETSLHLQEPIHIRENCPSPEPSININMNDYDNSDDDEDSVSTASKIGITFYKNLMDQVNKIIQKAQEQTHEECRNAKADSTRTGRIKDNTMHKVKEATFRHLKKVGVNLPPISDISESHEMSGIESNDISFAVKQLLMKYLPDEHLSKLSFPQTENMPSSKNQDKIILNSRAPEFSFATVQFMKKYNLIESNEAPVLNNQAGQKNFPPNCTARKLNNPKILDITALKQQPKLL